jgi:hypothetical protein
MSNQNKSAGGRSAVTGVKMGKGARRALLKNAECVDEVLDMIARAEAQEKRTDTKAGAAWLEQAMAQAAITLGRVTRSTGCGRLAVTMQTGEEVSVPIAGTVKFKGKSGTKTDRENCMCANDIIVIRGSFANAKVSPAAAAQIRRAYEHFRIPTPSAFFAFAEDSEAEDGYEFDRSEEQEAEAAEIAALKVAAAKASDGDVDIERI